MSGHNKWSKIKHKKAAKDAKRGNLFTKLAKAITLAAFEGGGDPDMNFGLRLIVDKAKDINMPNENIKRAIKKGTGEIDGGKITRISYEAYGPGGSGMIIDCATDNTNRTLSELKLIIDTGGGKFAESGSVSWQFEQKGVILVEPVRVKKSEKFGKGDVYEPIDKEDAILEIMEIEGVDDVSDIDLEDVDNQKIVALQIIVEMNGFPAVDKAIRNAGFKVISSELSKLAKDEIEVNDDVMAKISELVDEIEQNDDVDTVWVNV